MATATLTIDRSMIDYTLTFFADDPAHIGIERFIKLLRENTERSFRMALADAEARACGAFDHV